LWFQGEVHKAEAGDKPEVVVSLLSAGTPLKKQTNRGAIKDKYKWRKLNTTFR